MTADQQELLYHRVVGAAPDLVFACLTDPDHLTAFWGPKGTTSPRESIEVDLRAGGVFTTLMVSDRDGSSYRMRAVYDEVDPPRRLAWTDVDTGLHTTVTFEDLGDGRTAVDIRQTHLPPGIRAPEAQAGFLSSLDRFDDHLADIASGRASR